MEIGIIAVVDMIILLNSGRSCGGVRFPARVLIN